MILRENIYIKLFVNIFFGILTLLFLVFLFSRNIVFSGNLVYVQDFTKINSFVSDLWPPEAIKEIVCDSNAECARPFIRDYVTFFIKPPRYFESIILNVQIDLPQNFLPELYLQKKDSNGKPDWHKIVWLDSGKEQGLYVAQLTVEPGAWTDNSKRYNLKIEVPGLEKNNATAAVKQITAEFFGEKANLFNIWRLLRE